MIRATEGYTPSLPSSRRDVAPIYSLVVATEPLSDQQWESIRLHDRATFTDYQHLISYGQRSGDGRLVFGGRGAPYHFDSRTKSSFDTDPRVFNLLQRNLIDLFPVLQGVRFSHAWGGALGVARDWNASVGLHRETGLGWAGGYVGDGVSTTNLAGRTLADLITGAESEIVALPWVGHRSPRWEVEPLRWIGVNAGLQVMRFADASETRSGRESRAAKLFGRFLGH
ncbi:NAD(P)/FAD-dependent oxidoreductase [Nakamurella antarctica]|uniref:NAD(P)/FAD-dependent oxidoreductase n=1 Tax=Nakamurella antarctica TaxID=1902245 RepID=UPI0019D2CF6E|nr:FAD-binding oxidoreductase [Nakamurella antarctica]